MVLAQQAPSIGRTADRLVHLAGAARRPGAVARDHLDAALRRLDRVAPRACAAAPAAATAAQRDAGAQRRRARAAVRQGPRPGRAPAATGSRSRAVVGPRFAAVGIPPDHAAQARIVSFEPESLAEHTEFLMAETRAFAGDADAFCAQADSLIHRPGVAPAALRGMFKFADRFCELGPGRTGRPRAGTSTGSRPSRT